MKLLLHYIQALGVTTSDIHESCNWWQFCHEKWPSSIVSPHGLMILYVCSMIIPSFPFVRSCREVLFAILALSLFVFHENEWPSCLIAKRMETRFPRRPRRTLPETFAAFLQKESKETESERASKTFYAMKEISRDLFPFFIAHANRFQMSHFYCSPRS